MPIVWESSLVGKLVQDENFDDWWVSVKPMTLPYFDGVEIPVTFSNLDPGNSDTLVQDDIALANFLQLNPADRLADTEAAMKYYQAVLPYLDEPLQMATPADIWQYVQPNALFLTSETEGIEKDIYVQIEGNCEWEIEHGIALVFRQGRMLTRLSEYDGHLTEGHAQTGAADPLMERYYATYGRPI